MRAAVLRSHEPRLEVVEVEDPAPGPTEVVLAISACGICGSDLHVAEGIAALDTILGHEIAGTVAAVGKGVDPDQWPLGTPVVARPLVGCGLCSWCSRGRPDHCQHFSLIGLHRPGGFAEFTAVSATELFGLPATITGADHALVEPFAVARRALRRVALVPGEDVVVLGAGPIGLAVIAWSRVLGAGSIVASEPSPTRRALALALGADHVLDPSQGRLSSLVQEAGARPPAIVVECTGRKGLLGEAIGLAAIDGRVGVVGACTEIDRLVPYFGLAKELDVRFSIYYGREDFTDTLDILGAGLDVSVLVTETVALAELPHRFASLAHDRDCGKVVLTP